MCEGVLLVKSFLMCMLATDALHCLCIRTRIHRHTTRCLGWLHLCHRLKFARHILNCHSRYTYCC